MAINATETNAFPASFWDIAACSSEADTGIGAEVLSVNRHNRCEPIAGPCRTPAATRGYLARSVPQNDGFGSSSEVQGRCGMAAIHAERTLHPCVPSIRAGFSTAVKPSQPQPAADAPQS